MNEPMRLADCLPPTLAEIAAAARASMADHVCTDLCPDEPLHTAQCVAEVHQQLLDAAQRRAS